MMIDSAVYRAVSTLDRLANVLWYAVELPMERVYFRSGKVKKLHAAICSDETAHLLRIAEGKPLNFIIDYRDGLTQYKSVFPSFRFHSIGAVERRKWTSSYLGRRRLGF